MRKKFLTLLIISIVLGVTLVSGCVDSTVDEEKPIANVTNPKLVSEPYLGYKLVGKITFTEDADYTEITGQAHLKDGNVEDIAIVKNWASVKAGTVYNLDEYLLLTDSQSSSIEYIDFIVETNGKEMNFTVKP